MDETLPKLLEALERSPVAVALYDQFDRLRYASRAFREAFFIEEGEEPTWPEIMRRNFHAGRGTVIRAPDFDNWLVSTQSRRGKIGYRAYETDLADGRWLWMQETVLAGGWMLCVASDVTDLHSDRRRLRQDRDAAMKAALTDELTGIANRRFVMARIEDMLRERRREDWLPGCLAVLDIDNFKMINDRYGHQSGDQVLRDFANQIHANVRRSDCFGRVGGEEFVLVMPHTSDDEAALIVERMLELVRASRPLKDFGGFAYTFSGGIAEARSEDVSLSLYARADRALYSAKLGGRNRVLVAEEPARQRAARG